MKKHNIVKGTIFTILISSSLTGLFYVCKTVPSNHTDNLIYETTLHNATNYDLSTQAEKIDSPQILKIDYDEKLFTLDLKKYEINSKIHTVEIDAQKFSRKGSLKEKISQIKYLISIGASIADAFNIVCPKIDVDINKIHKAMNVQPINATIKFNHYTEKFSFTNEQYGKSLSKTLLYANILESFENNAVSLKLSAIKLAPDFFVEDFKKSTFIKGSFKTDYSISSPNRKHNIKLALSKFNGKTLMPGEVISFNETTGVRNQKNGYMGAKIIVDGNYIEGLGGGVCQASTTLYNAALMSDVEVLNSRPHSLPAHYVKQGFDAMVNIGSSDLVLKNSSNYPLTIQTKCTNTTCQVIFWGESMGDTKIELFNQVVAKLPTKPASTVSAEKEGVEQGTVVRPAVEGMVVDTYAIYKRGDTIYKTKKIRTSKYPSINEIIAV